MELNLLKLKHNGVFYCLFLNDQEMEYLSQFVKSHLSGNYDFYFTFKKNVNDISSSDISENDCLVISEDPIDSKVFSALICQAHVEGKKLISFEQALLDLDLSVPSDPDNFVRFMSVYSKKQTRAIRIYTALKYAFEPIIAFVMVLMLSPLIALVALAVKLTSPGPVFYAQTRVGHRGKAFDILKFRSMRADAEKDGPVWACAQKNDNRLSPIGGFLRSTHLDEIPQFFNVLKGELSFIGPRPERPHFVEKLRTDVPLFDLRTMIKPGITGWAQINQGYANSTEDSRRKLEYDLYYVMKHSPLLDIQVVLGTLGIVTAGGTEGRKREKMELPRPNRYILSKETLRRPQMSVTDVINSKPKPSIG